MLVTGIVLFLFVRNWRARNQKLQTLVDRRTEELRYSLLKLEASETELTSSLEFRQRVISILVHDLKSPMVYINRITKNLHNQCADLSTAEIQNLTDELWGATSSMTAFITDMLSWMTANQKHFNPSMQVFEFNSFLRSNCRLYFDIAEKKNVKVELRCPDSFFLVTDPSLFLIVIRNLLDNAIKNTVYGSVTIDANSDSTMQRIVIQDTGVGMSMEKIVEIENGIITGSSTESTQIGFRIIHDLLKNLSGSIKIESNSSGTKMVISLPRLFDLPAEHTAD